MALLDGNVKGLKADDPKFHSLVLSPSADELLLIGNNPKALESYTQNVMDLYAKNFTLKNGKQLDGSDLVWAATIHQERKNRGTDEGVQGEKKDGLQTHVHVMVSARDAAQKITLNPLGLASRFDRVQFQAQAVAQREMQFGRVVPLDVAVKEPTRQQLVAQKAEEITSKAAANRKEKPPLTLEQIAAKDARLDVQVARANTKLSDAAQLDPTRVKEIAKERNYDNVFYDRLGQIERNGEKGKHTPDPYQYLTTGRVTKEPQMRNEPGINRIPTPLPKREPMPEQRAGMQALERSMQKLARAIAPKGRSQDVRSEAEQAYDREYER